MAATKGNEFWKCRTKHGRGKIFETPEIFWKACCEYFQWVEDNPLWESKVTQYQGEPVMMHVDKMRAMTIQGLYFFLGINEKTWYNYKEREDFVGVVSEAEHIIYSQKFAGAAADLLNANIIARDLGLSDKSDVNHNVKVSEKSDEEIEQRIKDLIDAEQS